MTTDSERWIGLDIGGANIKIADSIMHADSVAFPLWKTPNALTNAIAGLINNAPDFDRVALTMTGELADCYATREEGVCRILEQVTQLIPSTLLSIYSVDGNWLTVTEAARNPWDVAASNWHATANFATRFLDNTPGIVVDIGSTTIDLTPIESGRVLTDCRVDSERLIAGQLLYHGIERTPVAAICQMLPLHSQMCPVMNELFATTRDSNLWLNHLPESPNCNDTADGRPATREHAAFRLARMVGEDGDSLAESDIQSISETIFDCQIDGLAKAISRQICSIGNEQTKTIISCGHGEFLLSAALRRVEESVPVIHLSEKLSPDRPQDEPYISENDSPPDLGKNLSRCAPAHAVATLAAERFSYT